MEMEAAPTWLNHEYLQHALRQCKRDEGLQLQKMELRPATGKGENFISIMTRLDASFRRSSGEVERGSYIVKTAVSDDPFLKQLLGPYETAQTEMLLYAEVLPKLTALLAGIGETAKVFAETIYVDYARQAIIFEDLAVLGYTVHDRFAGYDLAQAKLVLTQLAKLHASAAVLNEREPGLLTRLDHGMFNGHTRGFATYFEGIVGECAEFAGQCPELGPYYRDKLLKLQPLVAEHAQRVYAQREGFLSLSHGDCWVNNTMLRYDSAGALQDLVLIDFQFTAWASPAIDLHYFFQTSLETSLRLAPQEALVQYYHSVLQRTLRRLGFKGHIPTLHEFTVQMEAGRFIAVTSALGCYVFLTNTNTEDADLHAAMKNNERSRKFRKMLYTNPKVQQNVKTLLPYFDRRGLLDVVPEDNKVE